MNIALWVIQIALALVFIMAGVMKSFQPREKLVEKLPWVEDVSTGTLRIISVAELLAGIGLVLPAATGILAVLSPLAATGLVVIMALAMLTHYRRGEKDAIVFNLMLLVLAAFVAWGRFGPYAF